MALIKCENCGHMVSDKGTKCPKCGTPIHKVEETAKPIEKEEKVIAEVESPKVEIPKVERTDVEAISTIEDYTDEPKSNKWKKVCGVLAVVAVIGGIYLFINYQKSQSNARLEYEAMQKAKADSAMVADSLARVAAAEEQARLDSLNAVEAIRQKFVKVEDVYVDLSNGEKKHINLNLVEVLKGRGYELLKAEEVAFATADDVEVNNDIQATTFYLGLNMAYDGDWKATGSPYSGVEVFVSDEPHAYVVIHFENSADLEAFLSDAEKLGFEKRDKEWSRNTDYPHDFISKKDDTTLECCSEYPF